MFLNKLSKQQKDLVLELLIIAANADNDIVSEEKTIIEQYCFEMGVEAKYTADKSFEEALSELVIISSKTEMKMILIELSALIMSDNDYAAEEQQLITEFVDKSGLSNDDAKKSFDIINKLSQDYSELRQFIIN